MFHRLVTNFICLPCGAAVALSTLPEKQSERVQRAERICRVITPFRFIITSAPSHSDHAGICYYKKIDHSCFKPASLGLTAVEGQRVAAGWSVDWISLLAKINVVFLHINFSLCWLTQNKFPHIFGEGKKKGILKCESASECKKRSLSGTNPCWPPCSHCLWQDEWVNM